MLAGSFAVGMLILSTRPSASKDLSAILVGSVLTVTRADVATTIVVGVVVLGLLAALHKELVLGAFDPAGARALGYPVGALDGILLVAVTVTLVVSIPAVGTLLAIALLTVPALTARLWTDRLGTTMALAAALGAVSAIAGMCAAALWDIAAGGAIVLAAGTLFTVSFVATGRRRRHAAPMTGGVDAALVGAVLAQPDEVEAVVLQDEPVGRGDLGQAGVEAALDPGRQRDVAHLTARRADLVVVVLGQVLGQLEARPLVARCHTLHQPGFLEHGEVAVHRALRHPRPGVEDLRDGQRAVAGGQQLDQRGPAGGVPLAHAAQPFSSRARQLVHVVRRYRTAPSPVCPSPGEGYGGPMSATTDTVTARAQDLGTTVVSLAQDAVASVGELGANLVDSGLKKLQDAGVVEKPKRSKKRGFLAVLIIIVGGLVAYKVISGRRGGASSSPVLPEAERLADSTGVAVG